MKRTITAAITAVALIVGFSGIPATAAPLPSNRVASAPLLAQAGWQQFSSTNGKFQVQLPSQPQQEQASDEIEGQKVDLHQFFSRNDAGGYLIVYADLPNSYTQKGSATVLEEMGSVMLMSMGAEVLEQRKQNISLSGNPGLEYRYEAAEGVFVMRLYLVRSRMYLLIGESEANNINQFLSSFQLL
ncbi:MAG TPA: hypothetical protein IGS52_02940 [Oscillatoriaceae cyanobacterium M33_DOE_052]|uniref:DUF1795 domain-containing protein n=1 Tax=Planktothricoides sp. SpSt-374 TaxID=2282167 RepID=A0A7C3ZUU5_9CYAN|nr:hypothetical protein [Oscillatoriaceae cyanobacterium M33_DOE_052]